MFIDKRHFFRIDYSAFSELCTDREVTVTVKAETEDSTPTSLYGVEIDLTIHPNDSAAPMAIPEQVELTTIDPVPPPPSPPTKNHEIVQANQIIELEAPDTVSDSHFIHWRREKHGVIIASNPMSTVLNSDHTFTAVYGQAYELTVKAMIHIPTPTPPIPPTAEPIDVSVGVEPQDRNDQHRGDTSTSGFTRSYFPDQRVQLTAPLTKTVGDPGVPYAFLRWKKDGALQPVGEVGLTVNMTADIEVEAIYEKLVEVRLGVHRKNATDRQNEGSLYMQMRLYPKDEFGEDGADTAIGNATLVSENQLDTLYYRAGQKVWITPPLISDPVGVKANVAGQTVNGVVYYHFTDWFQVSAYNPRDHEFDPSNNELNDESPVWTDPVIEFVADPADHGKVYVASYTHAPLNETPTPTPTPNPPQVYLATALGSPARDGQAPQYEKVGIGIGHPDNPRASNSIKEVFIVALRQENVDIETIQAYPTPTPVGNPAPSAHSVELPQVDHDATPITEIKDHYHLNDTNFFKGEANGGTPPISPILIELHAPEIFTEHIFQNANLDHAFLGWAVEIDGIASGFLPAAYDDYEEVEGSGESYMSQYLLDYAHGGDEVTFVAVYNEVSHPYWTLSVSPSVPEISDNDPNANKYGWDATISVSPIPASGTKTFPLAIPNTVTYETSTLPAEIDVTANETLVINGVTYCFEKWMVNGNFSEDTDLTLDNVSPTEGSGVSLVAYYASTECEGIVTPTPTATPTPSPSPTPQLLTVSAKRHGEIVTDIRVEVRSSIPDSFDKSREYTPAEYSFFPDDAPILALPANPENGLSFSHLEVSDGAEFLDFVPAAATQGDQSIIISDPLATWDNPSHLNLTAHYTMRMSQLVTTTIETRLPTGSDLPWEHPPSVEVFLSVEPEAPDEDTYTDLSVGYMTDRFVEVTVETEVRDPDTDREYFFVEWIVNNRRQSRGQNTIEIHTAIKNTLIAVYQPELSPPNFCFDPDFAYLNGRTALDDYEHDSHVDIATDGRGKWIAVWQSKMEIENGVMATQSASVPVGEFFTDESFVNILCSVSTDNGKTWSYPVLHPRSDETRHEFEPQIETNEDGEWVVAWVSYEPVLGHQEFRMDDPVDMASEAEFDHLSTNVYPTPPGTYAGPDGGFLQLPFEDRPVHAFGDIFAFHSETGGMDEADWLEIEGSKYDPDPAAEDTNGIGAKIPIWYFNWEIDSHRLLTKKFAYPYNRYVEGGSVIPVPMDEGDTSSFGALRNVNFRLVPGNDENNSWIIAWETAYGLPKWIEGDASILPPELTVDDVEVDNTGTPSFFDLGYTRDILFTQVELEGDGIWTAPKPLNNTAFIEHDWSDTQVDLASDGAGGWVAVWSSPFFVEDGQPRPTDFEGLNPADPLIGREWDVVAAYSSDNGKNWSWPMRFKNHPTIDEFDHANDYASRVQDANPLVAFDGKNRWNIIWSAIDLSQQKNSTLVTSAFVQEDGTLSAWTPAQEIFYTGGEEATDDRRRFVSSPTLEHDGRGNWIYAYSSFQMSPIAWEMRYLVSDDNGDTWSSEQYLCGPDNSFRGRFLPTVANDGLGNWVLAYEDIFTLNHGATRRDEELVVVTSKPFPPQPPLPDPTPRPLPTPNDKDFEAASGTYGGDTFVAEASDTENYGFSSELVVGTDYTPNTDDKYALIQFSMTENVFNDDDGLNMDTYGINNAQLVLTCSETPLSIPADSFRTLTIHRLNRNFDEAVATWLLARTGETWDLEATPLPYDVNPTDTVTINLEELNADETTIVFDITDDMIAFQASFEENQPFGWIIKMETEDETEFDIKFHSSESATKPRVDLLFGSKVEAEYDMTLPAFTNGWTDHYNSASNGAIWSSSSGLCVHVDEGMPNGFAWQSPRPVAVQVGASKQVVKLKDMHVYRVQAHMWTNQTETDRIPYWSVAYHNIFEGSHSQRLGTEGGNTYGGETFFLDAGGGAMGVGRLQGSSVVNFWIAPNAVETAQWRGLATLVNPGDPNDPNHPSKSAYPLDNSAAESLRDFILDFKVHADPKINPGLDLASDSGTLCLQELRIDSVHLNHLNTIAGSYVAPIDTDTYEPMTLDERDGRGVAGIDAINNLARYQLPSSSSKTLLPYVRSSAASETEKLWPILWDANVLYKGSASIRSDVNFGIGTAEGSDPLDFITLIFDTPTAEVTQYHWSGSGTIPKIMEHAASPRLPENTGGRAQPYVGFFYTEQTTLASMADQRMRLRLNFRNIPQYNGLGGQDPFVVEDVVVERVEQPDFADPPVPTPIPTPVILGDNEHMFLAKLLPELVVPAPINPLLGIRGEASCHLVSGTSLECEFSIEGDYSSVKVIGYAAEGAQPGDPVFVVNITDNGGVTYGSTLESNLFEDRVYIEVYDDDDEEVAILRGQLYLDADDDGLSHKEETVKGTDDFDRDSDDDGLTDGEEAKGIGRMTFIGRTDPAEWDTDNDQLADGLEIGNTALVAEYEKAFPTASGYSSPVTIKGTDHVEEGVYTHGGLSHNVADADPSSTTHPRRPDTDGDGYWDGPTHWIALSEGQMLRMGEDVNGDGRFDLHGEDVIDVNDDEHNPRDVFDYPFGLSVALDQDDNFYPDDFEELAIWLAQISVEYDGETLEEALDEQYEDARNVYGDPTQNDHFALAAVRYLRAASGPEEGRTMRSSQFVEGGEFSESGHSTPVYFAQGDQSDDDSEEIAGENRRAGAFYRAKEYANKFFSYKGTQKQRIMYQLKVAALKATGFEDSGGYTDPNGITIQPFDDFVNEELSDDYYATYANGMATTFEKAEAVAASLNEAYHIPINLLYNDTGGTLDYGAVGIWGFGMNIGAAMEGVRNATGINALRINWRSKCMIDLTDSWKKALDSNADRPIIHFAYSEGAIITSRSLLDLSRDRTASWDERIRLTTFGSGYQYLLGISQPKDYHMVFVDGDIVPSITLKDLKNSDFWNPVQDWTSRSAKRHKVSMIINQPDSAYKKTNVDDTYVLHIPIEEWKHSFLANDLNQKRIPNSYYWWSMYCGGPVFIKNPGQIHGESFLMQGKNPSKLTMTVERARFNQNMWHGTLVPKGGIEVYLVRESGAREPAFNFNPRLDADLGPGPTDHLPDVWSTLDE